MDVALTTPSDRYDALAPTGTVTIGFVDVARLLTSLRPTGTAGMGAGAATLVRFGVFFAGRVLRAFLPDAASTR
jgi:hypothetical protein